jgi:hypothetical protein
MGLEYYGAREALRARRSSGISSVATIGQLQQYLLRGQIRALCREFGLSEDADWTRRPFGSYGNDFLRAAGASVTVIDASPYEGADVVHDMNEPVDEALHEQFDQVIDGGSLEHIFRPDQALANEMRMVRVGGAAIVSAPANNLCGHGFYQFSPEFFFSAFSDASGFQVESALLLECVYPSVSLVQPRRAYRVRSPREVQDRVGVVSRRPLVLMVRAVKTRHLAEPFAQTPQQSDYEAQWTSGESLSGRHFVPDFALPALSAVAARAAPVLRDSRVGGPVVRRILGERERRRWSLRNRSFFVPE